MQVVGVAGHIGAGKSVIAAGIADALGGERRSFGGVVRDAALAAGRPLDRATLQTLGDSIIASEGWDGFCRRVVGDSPTALVVVDGVRHVGAVQALSAIAAVGDFALVFVDAASDVRRVRARRRDGSSDAEFAAAEVHPNEQEVPVVRSLATIIVHNDSDGPEAVDLAVACVVRELRERGLGQQGPV